ncbi:UNVERIFIED_CONTAM: hypothetical protein Sradi_7015400 [Sesamum radiatum]|uniref:Myb/SANT-like domain-containing protein n=1 Tax=Sesamum radiatum TaxID=300843 RepID=A0AAW2JAE7_SESRA
MDEGGSNDVQRRGGKRDGKGTRRSWSTAEEEALIQSLKEIVQASWKCENGFRTGYLGILEQMIRKKCPSSGLKAVPHISSKIHVWKKTYGTLLTTLTRSGFGWNATNNTLDAKDDAFENYAKSDPFAHSLRYKSFPFYDEWCEVFGEDRATGENAEDIVSASCNVTSEPIPHTPEYYVPSPDPSLFGDDIEFMNSFSNTVGHNSDVADNERSSSKKRKIWSKTVDEKFEEKFDTFVSVTDNRLGDLAN